MNFDVSFPEKFLKIVATKGEIFSRKFTKYCLEAGLRPDPLGELKRSHRPPSCNKAERSRGERKGKNGEGMEEEGWGKSGKDGEGRAGPISNGREGKGKGALQK